MLCIWKLFLDSLLSNTVIKAACPFLPKIVKAMFTYAFSKICVAIQNPSIYFRPRSRFDAFSTVHSDNKIARYSARMLQTDAPAIFWVIVFILMRLRPFPFLSTTIRYVIDAYERDNLICMHFRFDPLSRAFSNRCVFDENAQRVSVDGRPKRIDFRRFLTKTH